MKERVTIKCLRNIGFCSFLMAIISILSFIISFAFSYVVPNWITVGWIVPLGVLLLSLILFELALAFALLIAVKEFLFKQTNITIGIFEEIKLANRYLDWVSYIFLMLFLIVSFSTILLTCPLILGGFIICLIYDRVVTKLCSH